MLREYSGRAYILPVPSVHKIRECLQIILDFAEHESNQIVITQVRTIMQEIANQRVNL